MCDNVVVIEICSQLYLLDPYACMDKNLMKFHFMNISMKPLDMNMYDWSLYCGIMVTL